MDNFDNCFLLETIPAKISMFNQHLITITHENIRQFYPSITQGQYYSFHTDICFIDTTLFSMFSFRKVFFTDTSYQTLETFCLTFYPGLHNTALTNLKAFVLNWCRMSVLICNMFVIFLSLTCWILILIMTSELERRMILEHRREC